MVACAYCEHPLICDNCQGEYVPPSQEQYEALSHREEPVTCPHCEKLLVCHWCKEPYEAAGEDGPEEAE
jgi:hypothetical protein